MNMIQVSQMVRQRRQARGMTQKQLADEVGLHRVSIARFETCDENLSIKKLSKVLEFLGLVIIAVPVSEKTSTDND